MRFELRHKLRPTAPIQFTDSDAPDRGRTCEAERDMRSVTIVDLEQMPPDDQKALRAMVDAAYKHAAKLREPRSLTPWFPVAVDPVHEGIYEVEYRQSRFIFRREWRDGVWCIPGAVLLPATRPKRWRGLTAPARTMPKDQR